MKIMLGEKKSFKGFYNVVVGNKVIEKKLYAILKYWGRTQHTKPTIFLIICKMELCKGTIDFINFKINSFKISSVFMHSIILSLISA